MLSRIFSLCLFLCLFSSGFSLSCRWLHHKFRQHSESSLSLLDSLANNSTNSTEEMEDTVAFPTHLYSQASNASAEYTLAFIVQVLNEAAALFQEDHSSASWEESTVEDFVNVITQQADGLLSCIGRHKSNKKLHLYFKRLSQQVLKETGHSAEAWELMRREIKTHLMRADLLTVPLLASN